MKKNILFFCITSLSLSPLVQAAPSFEPLPDQATQIRQSIERSLAFNEVLTRQSNDLERQLAQAEKALGENEDHRRHLLQQLSEQKNTVAQLEKKSKSNRKLQVEKQQALADLVKSLSQQYHQSRLQVVLSQPNYNSAQRILAFFPFLKAAEAEQIDQLKTEIVNLQMVEIQARRAHQALEDLQQQIQADAESRKTIQAERQALMVQLSEPSEHSVSAEASLETLMMHIYQKRSRLSLEEPAVLAHLKQSPLSSKSSIQSVRQGVFVPAQTGQPVKAVASGQVIFSDWIKEYGHLVIIDHGNNILSLYGHNALLHVEAGQIIDQGQTIARSGDSGGQTQSGLYFEVRHNGQPIRVSAWMQRTS